MQTELLKHKQQLEDRERELELDVQKGITAGLADVRSKAIQEAQAGLDLKVLDRDNTIMLCIEWGSAYTAAGQSQPAGRHRSRERAHEIMWWVP